MASSLSALKPKPAGNLSPIFPTEAFSQVDSSLKLPENELISAGSVSLSIVLAEPVIYLRGFSPEECTERPPSLLRGTLIVKVHKVTKMKAISLTFKGIARTEWPEGIPPKKSELQETKELHSHTWPFFNAAFPTSDYSSGANMIKLHKDSSHRHTLSLDLFDKHNGSISSLGHTLKHKKSNSSDHSDRSANCTPSETANSENSDSSSTTPSTRGVRGLAGRLRRAASPSPSFSKEPFFHSLNLGPRRSFSKDEAVDLETSSKGYRTFEPGDYYYNFELPIPQSLPESIDANFGSVHYYLEASIDRHGAFKTRVAGTKDVLLVRCPADNNIEINEPIAISKQWEDQLDYDIVISGKAFPIGTRIPMAFKLTPLAKIDVHRIRIFITENNEYYCRNKRVHRIEPTKKFMIEEIASKEGLTGNLLTELATGVQVSGDIISSGAELELNSLIPESFPKKREVLHPNSTYDMIQINHWIKIVLRISRPDPSPDAPPGRRKHYEISIDSPIHLLDSKCTNANVYLPAYIDPVSRRASVASMRPIPAGVAPDIRPIHYLRKPSLAPPPFSADVPPPSLNGSSVANAPAAMNDDAPPDYEEVIRSASSSYFERFEMYRIQRQKSYEEREALVRQKEQERRQRRPSVIVEANGQSSTAGRAALSGHATTGSVSSLDPPAEENSQSSHEEDHSNRSSTSTLLNTRMFSNQDSSTQADDAPIYTPASLLQQHQQRFQSTASVDIVDQTRDFDSSSARAQLNNSASSFSQCSNSRSSLTASQGSTSQSALSSAADRIDPNDPLSPMVGPMGSLQPVDSVASSTYDSGESLDELLPSLYSGSHPIERQGLLHPQQSAASSSPNKRIAEPGMRDRLDSSSDLGLASNNSALDDDQVSLKSTPSLWIS
ncbi:hypothetical protein DV452_001030 [Geotrichum candidum]|nr:hypothetical protein DV454_003298 [Geotrichum candidum]KAF5120807.1 hypothetical protein DV452_001030 [Geotrichum candidum]KAI9213829.1 hypothetical protein DS838_001258 [Geotrichum bryndzae]